MRPFGPEFSGFVTEGEPLAAHTSFGLGGRARWWACPRTTDQVARLVGHCTQRHVPLFALGQGANVLVSDDGVDGLVVRLTAPGFRRVEWPESGRADEPTRSRSHAPGRPVIVAAGGGADMHRLVLESVRRGLRGLEGLAGIPGTVGGFIRMNAGGRWGQISDVVREVTVVNEHGDVKRLLPHEVGFGYRHSRLGGAVVCQAKLELTPEDPAILHKRFMEIWRSKKRSQPLGEQSAGCVFKNPPGHSAGALIERAGLKGRSVGGACVSEVHANFIVVQEGATAEDVFTLIGQIRRKVAQQFGVELELEIQVWGRRQARSLEPVL